MRKWPRIRPEGDLHSCCERFSEAGFMKDYAGCFSPGFLEVNCFERPGVHVKRRHQVSSMRHHFFDCIIIELNAVLNRCNTRINAVMEPGPIISMARNSDPLQARLV